MEMKIADGTFASKHYVDTIMAQQIEEMGLKMHCQGEIYNPEPISTTEFTEGMWWWKKIYHTWMWKGLFKYSLEEVSTGEFILTVYIGADDQSETIKQFLCGVSNKLEGLKQTMHVVHVRWVMRDLQTTDKPSSYYY